MLRRWLESAEEQWGHLKYYGQESGRSHLAEPTKLDAVGRVRARRPRVSGWCGAERLSQVARASGPGSLLHGCAARVILAGQIVAYLDPP